MRRSTAVIISAFLVLVVLASPSSADYKRVDPDDVSWTPDIGLVSTNVQQARDRLNILVSYHDGKSHWWKRPAVHMLMDTRRTSRPDYLISIFWKNVGSDTKVHCRVHRMTPSGTRPAPRIIVTSWGYGNKPPVLDCSLEMHRFRTDGKPVQWRVVSYFASTPGRKDFAPNGGGSYPHL